MIRMSCLPFEREMVDYVLRNDIHAFAQAMFPIYKPGGVFEDHWYVQAICSALDTLMDSELYPAEDNRAVINLPPRTLKSYLCSIILPLFFLGRNPAAGITVITYGEELSRPLAEARRKIRNSDLYKRLFPNVRITRDTAQELQTHQGGFILSTSVGGPLTGRGGDLFVIDDPIKAADAYSKAIRDRTNDWFPNTLLSRPDNKAHGKILLVMQRLHVDDLTSIVRKTGGFFSLVIPAIATKRTTYRLMHEQQYTREIGEVLRPDAEPLDMLENLRQQMTEPVFSAQYQQEPIPAEGGILKINHLKRYQEPPLPREADTILQSWDTAFSERETADYSVGTTWLIRGDHYYLLDLVRGRFSFPELMKRVRATKQRWPTAHIVVEGAASGISLRQQLDAVGIGSIAFQPTEDKVARAHRITPVLEAGRIFVPDNASWLDAFITELAAFPDNGSHDDQVDSFCQAINWWETRKLRQPTTLFGSY